MSDFLFSKNKINQGIITEQILSIYNEDYPYVKEYHGSWGSVGVSQNLYNGFNPYENEEYIIIVLGGPILMFQENFFLNKKNSNEGTKAIFDRWDKNGIIWDEDLSGPFTILIINKETNEVNFITDMMSFIPIYIYEKSNNIILSTHVDVLADIAKQIYKIDEVSLVDFILNGIVTYPYTTYRNIFQIPPSSIHVIKQDSIELETEYYWLPKETNMYKSIKSASIDLSNSLQRYTNKITKETTNIAQFISGGEDSRVISGLLNEHSRNGYIFLDYMNREGKVANRIANIYNANLKVFTRSKYHYLNILPESTDLVGSGSQYQSAHTYGFHKKCNLNTYDAVFGGLFSDALLKGRRIRKIRGSSRFPFLPDIKKEDCIVKNVLNNSFFKKNILEKVANRRKSHLNKIKKIRKESAEEWFELWPSSMNVNISNMHVNRRLFSSYEPFMSSEVVKLSANTYQKWKLNRRLFHKATKLYLKPSKWVLHGDGWYPIFPWYLNVFIRFSTWSYRIIGGKMGWIKGNQGPWGNWGTLIYSDEWNEFVENKKYLNKLPIKDNQKSQSDVLKTGMLSISQYINLTQILYEIERNDKKKIIM